MGRPKLVQSLFIVYRNFIHFRTGGQQILIIGAVLLMWSVQKLYLVGNDDNVLKQSFYSTV